MMNSNTEYAKPLRAIGQDLAKLHVQKFELESDCNDYIVRSMVEAADQVDHDAATPNYKTPELRYTPEDLNRLEREGQAKRRDLNKMPNARSISEVLRAAGAYVNDTSSRLLGVIWQNQSVRIMYETALGSQEVDEIEVSSLYDFCMHMYLHRDKRRGG
jgi:hypothetical protein